jgi:thioesterase domain-containing protein
MPADPDRLIPLRDGGTRPPLFCLPAVSGSPYAYTGLVRLLGPDQPVYAFEAPGFDNDREPVHSIPALVEEYSATLTSFRGDGPFQLLGWSMGGVLAFEIARRLVAAGAAVPVLILVDAGRYEVTRMPSERDNLIRFIGDMMGRADDAVPGIDDLVGDQAGDDIDLGSVFAAVEKAEILPEEIDATVLGRQYAVFRAHLEAIYGFAPTQPYSGRTVQIVAAGSVSAEMMWSPLATDLTDYTVPGTHYSIWTDGLDPLCRIVRRHLAGGPE